MTSKNDGPAIGGSQAELQGLVVNPDYEAAKPVSTQKCQKYTEQRVRPPDCNEEERASTSKKQGHCGWRDPERQGGTSLGVQ